MRGALPVQAAEHGRPERGAAPAHPSLTLLFRIPGRIVTIVSHEADDRWRRPVDSCIAGDELRDYSGTRSGEKIDAHYVVDDNIEPPTEGSDCHNTAADHYPHDHSAEGHDHHHFASDRHDDDHDDDPNDDPNRRRLLPRLPAARIRRSPRAMPRESDNTDPNDGQVISTGGSTTTPGAVRTAPSRSTCVPIVLVRHRATSPTMAVGGDLP